MSFEPGEHYGTIAAKAPAVFQALVWTCHNSATGACFLSSCFG
jgi:hypothetical protein